jgi:peptide-methionine (S)-S-oxide reductase
MRPRTGSTLLRIARCALLPACLPAMTASSSSASSTPASGVPATTYAYFGGGCFWCIEAVFETEPGVKAVVSGYAGGTVANPSYRQVCTGTTGHAEVVRIEFDPAVISYAKLLDLFWDAHDPTTLNRQGADVGTQYRSIILYGDEDQKRVAEASKAAAQEHFEQPIVTEIVPLTQFFPAEDYHQDYFRHNGEAPYCRMVIAPKLKKLGRE